MGGVEKPIVMLAGRPMIARVIESLLKSHNIGRIYVTVSPKVPRTAEYLKWAYSSEKRVSIVETPGAGYVEDTARAVQLTGLYRPFLITSSDLPLITPEVIDEAIARYEASGTEALSVRLDASSVPPGLEPDTVLTDSGMRTVPAGINIIDGRHMDRHQEELILVVRDGRLAANVNYEKDLDVCERMLDEERAHR